MVVKPGEIFPGQETLLVISADTDDLQIRNFETEGAVSLVESDIQKLNVLAYFSALNQREALIGGRFSIERTYGSKTGVVVQGAETNRKIIEREAELEFKRSIGLFVVEATIQGFPGARLSDYEADAQRRWTTFQARYRSPRKVGARHRLAQELRVRIAERQSAANRAVYERPHESDASRTRRQLEPLTTRQRLRAISEDPRAQFIPANNTEKNQVLTYLDYLDNPAYPLGVNNQLLEIFNHNMRLKARSDRQQIASRAGISITYELYDHWQNAQQSLRTLLDLDLMMDDFVNPAVTISDEMPDLHPAVAPLIRYRDLKKLRDTGTAPTVLKDPLRTHEHRDPFAGPDGKHKTIEDPYTSPVPRPEALEYIQAEARAMRIKDARKLIKSAIRDQHAREAFFADRLSDIAAAPEYRLLPMGQLATTLRRRLDVAV